MGDVGAISALLPVAATTCCTWAPWALRALVLLATAVLLFVQIVATTTKEAMGAEDYVRPTMLDVGVGVARPSMRCAVVGGRTVRQKRGSPTMLMVGAVVLSNGAEMLMVGNVLVFMHNVGHVGIEESIMHVFVRLPRPDQCSRSPGRHHFRPRKSSFGIQFNCWCG